MTRVLVTGAGGQIGREVVEACAGDDVVATDHATLDVGDRDAVLQTITSTAPDVVVHAGAWTAVDACEGDPDRAFRVNALGTRYVAEGARRVGAWVCYLSTDYVFDGTKPEPYAEWDAPSPVSVYGRSKLGGEWEVDSASATIVRTSWVCGLHGNNMVKTVLRLAEVVASTEVPWQVPVQHVPQRQHLFDQCRRPLLPLVLHVQHRLAP